jgi:transcriptional regulator with XRE-family HTH domain
MKISLKPRVLKEKLARRNMSQNCFVLKLKVSSGYMSQLFSGARNPSPKLRKKILDALGLGEKNFDEIFKIRD